MRKILIYLFILGIIGCSQRLEPYDAEEGLKGSKLNPPVYLPSTVVDRSKGSGGSWSSGGGQTSSKKMKCQTWRLETDDDIKLVVQFYNGKFSQYPYSGVVQNYGSAKEPFFVSEDMDNSFQVSILPRDFTGGVSTFEITECQ